jgi:hypothetical protein
MRRAPDILSAINNLRIAVAETLGANRDAILYEASIGSVISSNPKARIRVEQAMHVPRLVPGIVRPGIEFLFYSFATRTLYNMGSNKLNFMPGTLDLAHYVISFNRKLWILTK